MKRKIALLSLLLVLFTSCSVSKNSAFQEGEGEEKTEETTKKEDVELDYSIAEETLELVEDKYLDFEEIDEKSLSYGLARGVVDALDDPYSEFLDPEETKNLEESLAGNLSGIGAELTYKNGMISVVSPLRGSPAEKAGLMPQDVIVEVDGESTENLRLWEVVTRIRGEKGTDVTLTVFREGADDLIEIIITRDEIHVPSSEVEWVGENEKIAQIILSAFNENTGDEFFESVQTALDEGAESLILDLRYNGGGYLDDSIEVASVFLEPNQKVVEVKGKGFFYNTTYETKNVSVSTDLPLVVLANKGSASGSEIVAGALKDHGRAELVGETTFGKGTVQELIILSDGSSLRTTVARWYTPEGTSIDHNGIEPDFKIENTAEELEQDIDAQLNKAIEILENS